MQIVNETRGCVLAERAELATRALDRMRGLLGRDGLDAGTGLVIDPCNSIHTFFMRFPIDVLFLDVEGDVIRAFDTLPPWRLTRIYAAARQVVELPAGRLSATGTEVGDRIVFSSP
jgi:uncharacterized protein